MISAKNCRLGFFCKSKGTRKDLLEVFEQVQKLRLESSEADWHDRKYVNKLLALEKRGCDLVLRLLKENLITSSDDYYRAAYLFHHGKSYKSYLVAVSLASVSASMGDAWGKNMYALALDRLLLPLGLPQHFGTQFIYSKGKWKLEKYRKDTKDKERNDYFVEKLRDIKMTVRSMNRKKSG